MFISSVDVKRSAWSFNIAFKLTSLHINTHTSEVCYKSIINSFYSSSWCYQFHEEYNIYYTCISVTEKTVVYTFNVKNSCSLLSALSFSLFKSFSRDLNFSSSTSVLDYNKIVKYTKYNWEVKRKVLHK